MLKLLLISELILVGLFSTSGYSSDDLKKMDSSEAADYVVSHIEDLNTNIAKYYGSIKISSIDVYDIKITTLGTYSTGKFLDFDSDNGYMTIGDGCALYDFQLSKKSPFDGLDTSEYCYNGNDGYGYFDKNNTYVNIKTLGMEGGNDFPAGSAAYDGQEESGDGEIVDTAAYVKARYGNGYSVERSGCLHDNNGATMPGYLQYSLSCYVEQKSTGLLPENNCGLVAAYSVADFISKKQYTDVDGASTLSYYPRISESDYCASKTTNSSIIVRNLYNTKKLYVDSRKAAFAVHGSPEGLSIWDSSGVVETVMAQYGHTINYVEEFAWGDYGLQFYKEIDAGRPLMLNVKSSTTYGAHTMAVCGYIYYLRVTSWWIFKSTSRITLVEVRDGWNFDREYFDLSCYVGFGGFCRWAV